MKNNICDKCGTENEPEYQYCKNCGAKIEVKNNQENNAPYQTENFNNNQYNNNFKQNNQQQNYQQPNNHQQNFNGQNFNSSYSQPMYNTPVETIDGVRTSDVAMFVGKNNNKYMPKFISYEITKSKVSWCWPPVILSFFIGPLGAAIWFLYRKMYKIGLTLLAVGLIFSVSNAFLTADTTRQILDKSTEIAQSGSIDDILNAFQSGDLASTSMNYFASMLSYISRFGTLIITGLFGYNFYKNHCISKIKGYLSTNPDPRYYNMALQSLGGTSGGMLALGIILSIIISTVSSYFVLFIK